MLANLYIRDFTIVSQLEISFTNGLTVLTGETGAGKSIIIDALALVLGQRADNRVIRHGCQRTEITASFELVETSDAALWLKEHDLFGDSECVVRRIIELDKPTKGFINGRPTAMQQLRELGDYLVDIHGQHEHQSLLKRDGQRQVLDDFADISDAVSDLTTLYRELTSRQDRLKALHDQKEDRSARIELLQYQVSELEALDLQVDEIGAIEEEHARLANGAELLEGVQSISQELYDSEVGSASQILGHAVRKLEALSEHDPKLGELMTLLTEASIQVDEAASGLHNYIDDLELDPQRLEWLDLRLGAIQDLSRKHQTPPEALPEVLPRLQTELSDIEDFDVNLAKLENEIEQIKKHYLDQARHISSERQSAAAKLGGDVSARMQDLGMQGGKFSITLVALDEGEIGPTGLERAEFLVSANPGQPLLPLSKVASGGELSRISLALQVIIATIGRIPTLIFDEVDVGIGGRVAEIVGQQLHQLGQSRQVACITHQAQVAAQGDQHLQVTKDSRDGKTVSHIRSLSPAQRIEEIARMIGGIEISQQTRDHAEDMLSRASA
ncbi:MAG: DNA repair protein RecN [Acidiferrobacterales bacterium]